MKPVAFIVGTFVSCVGSASLTADPVDVYILAGQSNLEGRAHRRNLPEELAQPQPDILYFYGDTWEPLAPGGSRKPPPPDGFGPEITFGRTLADTPGRTNRVALIKHARGGTSLSDDWHPENGPLWHSLQTKVATAIEQLRDRGHRPVLRAFIWMQGEADASTPEQAKAYRDNLTAFLRALREQWPAIPVVLGRINAPEKPHRLIVRQAQESVAETTPHTTWIDTDDLPFLDRIHYNSAALQELGRRFAQALP